MDLLQEIFACLERRPNQAEEEGKQRRRWDWKKQARKDKKVRFVLGIMASHSNQKEAPSQILKKNLPWPVKKE